MPIDLNGKRVDLPLLSTELVAAGVPHTGLGTSGDGDDVLLFTFTAAGEPADLPPEAGPVVAAHAAPPLVVEYAGTQTVDAIAVTTDDQLREVFRFSTTATSVYRGTFHMTAIDRTSGVTKDTEARVVFKRTAAAVTQVGTTAVLSNVQDTGAASWSIVPSVDGTDLVISVRGAAGRTIDWLLVGDVGRYAPEGLEG